MKSTNKKPIVNGFIKLPFQFAQRTDLSWTEKGILGYIYTRSKIKCRNGGNWTISAPDIVNLLGISKQHVYNVLNKLEKLGMLTLLEMRVGQGHPFKVYNINQITLLGYMGITETKSTPETKSPRTKSTLYHLEEERRIEEETNIEEKSTRVMDHATKIRMFDLACKNLPTDKSTTLYKSMYKALLEEYGISTSVLTHLKSSLN